MDDIIKIGLLGLGTIGSGVVKVLQENSEEIQQRLRKKVLLKKILERNPEKAKSLGISPDLITERIEEIINDPEISIVVELLGGIEPARQFMIQALRNGKHVVTANKDVIAAYGKELFEAAVAGGVDLYFEASVGGGIPIIRVIKESLVANRFEEVIGIVNGTTNYILTQMGEGGISFSEALHSAQEAGYAEANPAADIEGLDAARKIAILACLAYNARVCLDDVYVEGITSITPEDLAYARELGYCIKLLAIAREREGEIEAYVYPALLPLEHPLAAVKGVFNAIFVRGNAVGETMFYGQGAGQLPTASAVVGDIMQIIHNIKTGGKSCFPCTCYREPKIRSLGKVSSSYYVRMIVKDSPGVLANIAGVFGNHGVSLASVIQKRTIASPQGLMAELVLITHQAIEQNLQDALIVIKGLPIIKSVENVIRVERG